MAIWTLNHLGQWVGSFAPSNQEVRCREGVPTHPQAMHAAPLLSMHGMECLRPGTGIALMYAGHTLVAWIEISETLWEFRLRNSDLPSLHISEIEFPHFRAESFSGVEGISENPAFESFFQECKNSCSEILKSRVSEFLSWSF